MINKNITLCVLLIISNAQTKLYDGLGADFGLRLGLEATKEGVKIAKQGVEIAKEGVEIATIGAECLDKIIQAGKVVAMGVTGAVVVVGVSYGAYRVYYWFRPTEEQKLKIAQQIKEQKLIEIDLEIIKAEKSLKQCLLSNTQSPLNSSGYPVKCEKCVSAFSILTGKEKTHEIISDFQEYNPSYSDKEQEINNQMLKITAYHAFMY